jgi:hypothetical protein
MEVGRGESPPRPRFPGRLIEISPAASISGAPLRRACACLKANDLSAQSFALLHVVERVVQAGACDRQRNPGCDGCAVRRYEVSRQSG